MMVDATLMLWKRCKEVFARYQTGSTDNPKYLHRMENAGKVRSSDCYTCKVRSL